MDTQIFCEFIDNTGERKTKFIEIDRAFCKKYKGSYDTDHNHPIDSSVSRRLFNASLVWREDGFCKKFLSEFKEFCEKTNHCGYKDEFDEKFIPFYNEVRMFEICKIELTLG